MNRPHDLTGCRVNAPEKVIDTTDINPVPENADRAFDHPTEHRLPDNPACLCLNRVKTSVGATDKYVTAQNRGLSGPAGSAPPGRLAAKGRVETTEFNLEPHMEPIADWPGTIKIPGWTSAKHQNRIGRRTRVPIIPWRKVDRGVWNDNSPGWICVGCQKSPGGRTGRPQFTDNQLTGQADATGDNGLQELAS